MGKDCFDHRIVLIFHIHETPRFMPLIQNGPDVLFSETYCRMRNPGQCQIGQFLGVAMITRASLQNQNVHLHSPCFSNPTR